MNMLSTTTLTMSSREIAKLTDKEHKTVMRDIRVMLKDLGHGTDLYLGQYSSNNRMYDEYNLPKRETLLLVSGYLLHVRVKIVDRITELESKQFPTLPNFNNPAEAARAWADKVEAEQAALLLVEEKSRQVEILENLFHNGGTIAQFAKQLNGVNSQKINHWLYTNTKWLYDDNKGKVDQYGREKAHAWRCGSYARDKYLTETNYNVDRQGSESIVKYEVQLLANGKKWLFKKYTDGKLPMKTTWNGEFTHEKDLA